MITVTIKELVSVPIIYSVRVLRFVKFFPKGPTADGGERKCDLVQLWTDPGGMRTLALKEINLGQKKRSPAKST